MYCGPASGGRQDRGGCQYCSGQIGERAERVTGAEFPLTGLRNAADVEVRRDDVGVEIAAVVTVREGVGDVVAGNIAGLEGRRRKSRRKRSRVASETSCGSSRIVRRWICGGAGDGAESGQKSR